MADILQHRRGNTTARSGYAVGDGELWVDTDTYRMFVGDGSTPGGRLVSGADVVVSGASTYYATFNDSGKLLVFNGTGTAVTLEQAGTNAGAGQVPAGGAIEFLNIGSGALTITPNTSSINGGTALNLLSGRGAIVYSDGTNYYALSTGGSGGGGGIVMVSKTASYPLVSADNGTHFDNIGASVGITFTLLAAVRGFATSFLVDAAHQVTVLTSGSDVIRYGGNVTAGGGSLASSTVGAYLAVESHKTGEWITTSFLGDWA